MKKSLFVLLIGIILAKPGLCDNVDKAKNLFVMQVGDKRYYVKDLDLLESLFQDGTDMCFEYGNGLEGQISNLYKVLYNACIDGRARLQDQARKNDNLSLTKKAEFRAKQLWRKGKAKLSSDLDYKSMLVDCLIDKADLTYALSSVEQTVYKYNFNNNIANCIRSIKISPDAMCSRSDLFVPDASCLDNMDNLDDVYATKKAYFTEGLDADAASDKVLVFNGKVLVACERGEAKYVVKPSFSGRMSCQNGEYQYVGGVGHLPNGVYLALVDYMESMDEKQQVAWGQHRIPLVPSMTTNTGGRHGFYLHGTTNPDKRQSGGCISLGVAIDELVETDWFTDEEYIPVIVNVVDDITQEDRNKCEYK